MINFSIPLRRRPAARVLFAPCLLAGAFLFILTQARAAEAPAAKPAKPAAKPAVPPAKPVPPKKLESYTETIPGTTVKIEMIAIPAGPGQKPFWIEKTELPWEAYDIYAFKLDESGEQPQKPKGPEAAAHPSKPYGAPDHGFGHQGYPALSVTALAAFNFCAWLSEKTGKKYRLPTEKEWEYAARAGSTVKGPLPKEELDKVAWYWDNTQDKTEPVATKQPNAWGLYDMLGNAGEWCLTEKSGPLLCGGTYKDKAEDVTFSSRKAYSPDWQLQDPQNPKSSWWLSDGTFVGFRIVRED